MKRYSTTEARKNLSEIINRVHYEKTIVAVGRHDKVEVLIVPGPDINEELPMTEINAASSSFDFLGDEPDMYSIKDLKKRYV